MRGVERGAPHQRDQAPRLALEVVERERALALGGAHLRARDQAAQPPVAVPRRHEHGQAPQLRRTRRRVGLARRARPDRELAADDGLDPGGLRGEVEPGRPVEAIAIEQRQRRIPERHGPRDERFGRRRAFQERERGRGVEFCVHRRLPVTASASGTSLLPTTACGLRVLLLTALESPLAAPPRRDAPAIGAREDRTRAPRR